jgi:hypothetical protein
MNDGGERTDESVGRADTDSSPSLAELVERIGGGRKGSPRNRGGDGDAADPGGGARSTDDDRSESEFVFRAADRSSDAATAGADPARDTDGRTSAPPANRTETPAPEPEATPDDPGSSKDSPDGATSGSAFGDDAKREAILELIGDARNVLLSGPPSRPPDYDLCTGLLARGGDVREHLLVVTLEESPDERLNVLQGHLGSLPADVTILNVGDTARRDSTEAVHTTETGDVTVTTVPDATDIQRIGLAINKCLSEWDGDGETALCFHSLTGLVHAVDSESVFRFLNVLLGRVRSGGVRAHYHIDPGAHDEELLATYRPLFDETLRFEEDGSVRIDR